MSVAQLIYPEVTADLQRLPEEARVKLAGIDSLVALYLKDTRQPWNRDDGGYDLDVQVSIFFTDYSPNPQEDKFKANLIVTNKRDARFEDKRWEFGMRTPYTPTQGSFDPFVSVIEFYVWLLIANEEDKYEKLGGDRYYEKARSVQLSSTSSIYYTGWDKRSDLLRELTSEGNKNYREFVFFYFTGLYFNDESLFEDAKAYLHYALLRLDALPIEKRNEVLDHEHAALAEALKNCNYARGIDVLRQMDPIHKDAYDQIFGSPTTP
ncbi:MAG: DUF4835 family protein [Calditrichaeota bacterium]|nr:DUF4835 family protein [Calditrichota bacterium]MCB9391129.1 DUF4835 family protein [Calditrichota bacterium]